MRWKAGLGRMVGVVAVLGAVAGCSDAVIAAGDAAGVERPPAMSADQALSKVNDDLHQAVALIAPTGRGRFDEPIRDAKCGAEREGKAGQVQAEIFGELSAKEWDRDAAAAITKLKSFASERDYTPTVEGEAPKDVNVYLTTFGKPAEIFLLTFTFTADHKVILGATTPCSEKPAA